MAPLKAALKTRFLRFRRELIVVAYAIRHPRTPLWLRVAGLVLILYLVSPVDLVPIWIPVLGLVDDLVIVPWGVGALVRRLPEDARMDAEASAVHFIQRYVRRPLVFLALLLLTLLLLWAGLLALLWWVVFR